MRVHLVSIALSSVLFISSCNHEEKETGISSDVINIPSTASGNAPAETGTAPVIVFNEEKHDFGKIIQGEKVSHSFVFRNAGGSDLVISSAQGSCGCTVPHFPEEPIKPGAEGKIDVVFNSEGKSGLVQKTITLVTNCNPSTKMLTITSTTMVPEEKKE